MSRDAGTAGQQPAPVSAVRAEGKQPAIADLLTAARAVIPVLDLLGDFIGNTFDGKVGVPAFDRCAVILALKTAIANAESISGPGRAAGREEQRMILAVSAGVDYAKERLGLGSERDDDLAGVIAKAIEAFWRQPGRPPTWQEFITEHYNAERGTRDDPATWWDFAPAAASSEAPAPAAGTALQEDRYLPLDR
jgi:hypothetical protein